MGVAYGLLYLSSRMKISSSTNKFAFALTRLFSAVNILKSESYLTEEWAASLPSRSDLHIARKLWHMTMGLTIALLYANGFERSLALKILLPVLMLGSLLEVVRLKCPAINARCMKVFGFFIRTHEVNRISGMPYFVASSAFAIAFFPRDVAVLSLLYLALGDPIASFFGVLNKNRSIQILPGKSLHGTSAGFVACALATWVYLSSVGMQGLDLLRMILLGGFAGSVAELFPLDLDDNLTIPIISGFIVWLGFIAIQFF